MLDGRVPNLLEVVRECRPPLNRSLQFRAEGVRLVQSASGISQVGPAQGLVFLFFAQDIHRRRIILRLSQCPGSAISLAAFQVSTDGRIWVSPEAVELCGMYIYNFDYYRSEPPAERVNDSKREKDEGREKGRGAHLHLRQMIWFSLSGHDLCHLRATAPRRNQLQAGLREHECQDRAPEEPATPPKSNSSGSPTYALGQATQPSRH